jgi:hypothetical protein
VRCQELERTGRGQDLAVGEKQLAELRDTAEAARAALRRHLL